MFLIITDFSQLLFNIDKALEKRTKYFTLKDPTSVENPYPKLPVLTLRTFPGEASDAADAANKRGRVNREREKDCAHCTSICFCSNTASGQAEELSCYQISIEVFCFDSEENMELDDSCNDKRSKQCLQ